MSKRKLFIGGFLLLFLGILSGTGAWDGSVVGIGSVFAQGGIAPIANTFVEQAVRVSLFVVTILNFFAWLVMSILHHVIDPEFIFALDAGGTDGPLLIMLREIWQFTRDLVNLGFAIGLIVGAIIMIVTADGTKIKEHLPKFVIGIVLVNFSWFIPRMIFDFSNVLTYTIYQIPSLLNADGCTLPPGPGEVERRQCQVMLRAEFLNRTSLVDELNGTHNDGTAGWTCPLPGVVCIQKAEMRNALQQVRSPARILDGLVVNHARLQWLPQVDLTAPAIPAGVGDLEAVRRLTVILAKLIVIIILHAAIVFPLMAMVVAFLIRIPVLWISIAFMPLIALGFAFPKLKEGEFKDLFWSWYEHFMQAVFLPAKVAVPFVIAFIMLNAGSQLAPPIGVDFPVLPIFAGVGNEWQFIWMVLAIFIIWKYSFDTLKQDKAGVMGMFTEKIQGFGSSLGSLARDWSLSQMRVIPFPGRDASGNMQWQRISPLDIRRGLNLNSMRSELQQFGKLRSFEQRANLARNEGAEKTIRSDVRINQQFVTHIEQFQKQAADPALQRDTVRRTLEEFRKQFPTDRTSNARAMQLILRATNRTLTPAEQKQLEAAMAGLPEPPGAN